ncbi:membrane protein [Arthrobacter phage Persistence]|uniref:Membrane protein n=1 Tax=Arthrobacter phage Persistence TaxID=2836007 RepID=A0A8F3IKS7_9CAUD|nr:membrane protein [Arthrobacter phage Persistence]QWY79657.1 membrane protein [Arthrobacter phage Persistence]
MTQIATAILRTVIPALWGSLITWLIGMLPILAPLQSYLMGLSQVILPIATAVVIGAWYAFWRWLEPRLPDWLTRAVLGSAKAPVYPTVSGSQAPNVNPPAKLFEAPLFKSRDGKHEA